MICVRSSVLFRFLSLLLLCMSVVFFCIYVLLYISFLFFLDKGLILLFCIFPWNYCPFLSRLFFFVVCLLCICLVIIVNKLEVWWQYLPPTYGVLCGWSFPPLQGICVEFPGSVGSFLLSSVWLYGAVRQYLDLQNITITFFTSPNCFLFHL